MVELSFIETCIRLVILNLVIPVAILVITPFRIIFDFFTISHPDFFGAWTWATLKELGEARIEHDVRVKLIIDQVVQRKKLGVKSKMCTGRSEWKSFNMRNLNKQSLMRITMDLDNIVYIDDKKKILMVEPGVKMGTLISKLLPLGWTIPVLPELESLTVGGCVCGGGIETSSHKYGLFSDTCIAYEIVLADGSRIKCSKDKNEDVFYNIPYTHGSIGLLTAVYFELIPATKYVKIEYFPTTKLSEAQELIQDETHDFVEGIMYGQNKFVVMHGTMVNDKASEEVNSFSKWYSPWFYKHVENFLKTKSLKRQVEYIRLADYYKRHQRSLFWEVDIILPYGNHPLFRYLLGWILPINVQLMKLITPKYFIDYFSSKNHVLQDIMVPMSKLEDIIALSHKELQVYPIWLCPTKIRNVPTIVHPMTEQEYGKYIDVGIYGICPKAKEYDLEKSTRKLEKFALDNKGIQALYAETFLSREEFQKMFDLEHYEEVRKKYNCNTAFPHVYDKICRAGRTC